MHERFRMSLLPWGLALALLFLWQALSGAGSAQQPTPQERAKSLYTEIDALYSTRRSEAEVARRIKSLLEEVRALEGETFDYNWRMARIQWWNADGMANNPAAMATEARQGWSFAEKAVAANPNRVEGQFWLAANIGQYSLGVGVLKALQEGLENKFLTPLEKSIKLNPQYEDAAPIRTKGTYYLNLPWPMRDLDKAIELLSQAARSAPRGIRNRWYLAQAYEKNDDIPAAIKELDLILSASSTQVDPGDLPRLKAWAKAMKARLQEK